MQKLKELYRYRTMIASLIRKDLRGRYKGSFLGFLWTFLNPLLQLCVYTLVFSVIMRSGVENYYLFLFVALVPWLFFATSVSGGCQCILGNKNLVSKIYFPREVLVISHVTTGFVNMLYSFIVVFGVIALSPVQINVVALLYLPLIMMLHYLLALGIAFIVSSVTVYFRDMEHIMGIIVMAWQFLTPVMYPLEQVPEEIRSYFQLNPMTQIIVAYRDILFYGEVPQVETLTHALVCGTVFAVFGVTIFQKLQKRFAEEL